MDGDENLYKEMVRTCAGLSVFVSGHHLASGYSRGLLGSYSNAASLHAKVTQGWSEMMKTDVDQAFDLERRINLFFKQHITPLIDRDQLNQAVACMEAVFDVVKDRADIIIEGHDRFETPTAVRIGNALSDFDILWFEEPIPPQNFERLAEVKRRVNAPASTGERLYNRWDYKSLFELKALDYIQLDVSYARGIMELKKIADMTESYHIPFCPHNPSGSVANAATLQLAACVPDFYLLETISSDVPWRSEVSTEIVDFTDGRMGIPELPRLEIDISEEEIRKHLFEAKVLRHYNGTLTDIRPVDHQNYY